MMKALAAVVVLLASPALAAEAGGAWLHSDPAAGDNLRLYAFIDAPTVELGIDRNRPASTEGMSVMFLRLEPGRHAAAVTVPDGGGAALGFTLAADEMIESKGRRWWCLTVGRRNGELVWIQLPPAQCKALADKGPD